LSAAFFASIIQCKVNEFIL